MTGLCIRCIAQTHKNKRGFVLVCDNYAMSACHVLKVCIKCFSYLPPSTGPMLWDSILQCQGRLRHRGRGGVSGVCCEQNKEHTDDFKELWLLYVTKWSTKGSRQHHANHQVLSRPYCQDAGAAAAGGSSSLSALSCCCSFALEGCHCSCNLFAL